ncbi:MAG: GNAT family N-acetyltransferase [Candidatus Korarchaeota archaeon]|nr:GNAT family N-acetyltransferase [Candidatus Korarchaeota archaeon]NIU84124.1 GNAT family N-acetyltransferase [Candidatus Thorarchaeota archaeon]NIW14269.1 GNAT family N-acetyltransferase [Candidatus Thorarchaeota archaeon]NIW52366.1 GNAT family N-acetyltransferase [Candidatus Korarchaeota archaeon]
METIGHSGKVIIRKAKKADVPPLVGLDQEASQEIDWWKPLERSDFLKKIESSDWVYVTEEKGRIVAYLTGEARGKTIELENVYVQKEDRGGGIATHMIKRFLSDVKATHYEEVRLFCPENLREFYESFGFEIEGIIMKKELNAD